MRSSFVNIGNRANICVDRIVAIFDADAEKVRIIAMTANTFAEDVLKARNAGIDGHLPKPIDIPLLMQTLHQLV